MTTDYCDKKCYHNRKIARKFKRLIQRQLHKKLTIYYCSKCESFHYTSMNVIVSRQIKRRLINQKEAI